MDLGVEDVAELLNVSVATLRHWIQGGKIPSYRLNRQYRFSRVEIEDWIMKQHLDHPGPPKSALPRGSEAYSLFRALHHGGIFEKVPGNNKETIIRSTCHALGQRLGFDSEVVCEMLLDREAMMPTALGSGIAVPHTRDFILSGPSDAVAIVFPENPIDWGALDGKPVHTLFFLFALDDISHLRLLAKIAHLSSKPEVVTLLQSRPPKDLLLETIRHLEEIT